MEEIIQHATIESALCVAEAIRENARANGRILSWGSLQNEQQGQVGMHFLSYLLFKAEYPYNFPKSIGRPDHFDMTIFNLPFEIKTAKTNAELKDALENPNFGFLVDQKQYDKGTGRGVKGYISILVNETYTRGAFRGWIEPELVTIDKEGKPRRVMTHDKSGKELETPAYFIPCSELNSFEELAP
jgi:hypothetical protein